MSESKSVRELPRETQERVYRVLGEGVARAWSGLPQAIQQELLSPP